MGCAQDVGALGHEVDAAEHDELRLRPVGDLAGKAERVAGVIGEPDDLVSLVVMSEDNEAAAERLTRGGNATLHLLVRQTQILLGQRLTLGDVLLLVVREQRDDRPHSPVLRSAGFWPGPTRDTL